MGRPQELTKEQLLHYGITDITEDGRVFMGDYERKVIIQNKSSRYGVYQAKAIQVYDRDVYERGKSNPKPNHGTKNIIIARAMWAWFYGKCPANMDVDHIDGDSLNNNLSNLQLLTRSENLQKRKGYMNQHASSYRA